eukprot:SAG25_NODE_1568_length_2758_cov_2.285446_1_plen_173_part_00
MHQAADPKVYFDPRLGAAGAWVMLYFGTCPLWKGASINVAFSLDLFTWCGGRIAADSRCVLVVAVGCGPPARLVRGCTTHVCHVRRRSDLSWATLCRLACAGTRRASRCTRLVATPRGWIAARRTRCAARVRWVWCGGVVISEAVRACTVRDSSEGPHHPVRAGLSPRLSDR